MQDRSNRLDVAFDVPMRHADTYELHRVAPCVGYIPGGIHGNTVRSLSRRLVPGPYEGPVVLPYLRLKGYLMGKRSQEYHDCTNLTQVGMNARHAYSAVGRQSSQLSESLHWPGRGASGGW